MKVSLIGGVNSSALTLKKLCEYQLDIVNVFGYRPKRAALVSGHCDLEDICAKYSVPFSPFLRINDHIDEIRSLNVDVIFVVGLSQLVSREIIEVAKIGAIGFHPTKLPKGRGRAPIAWLVNEIENGAATFFVLEEEADSGAILAQKEFSVTERDTSNTVERKMLEAMKIALDQLLPQLKRQEWLPAPQDESLATEYGSRKPEDGLISWGCSAFHIDRLVKAASDPHPGAFTYLKQHRIPVAAARLELDLRIRGIVGRILKVDGNQLLVQTGDGLIWISVAANFIDNLKVGQLLGYKVESEIFELKQQVQELRNLLGDQT